MGVLELTFLMILIEWGLIFVSFLLKLSAIREDNPKILNFLRENWSKNFFVENIFQISLTFSALIFLIVIRILSYSMEDVDVSIVILKFPILFYIPISAFVLYVYFNIYFIAINYRQTIENVKIINSFGRIKILLNLIGLIGKVSLILPIGGLAIRGSIFVIFSLVSGGTKKSIERIAKKKISVAIRTFCLQSSADLLALSFCICPYIYFAWILG